MELKQGYKQTEVGLIPEDWEVATLNDAVVFLDNLRRPIKSSERLQMKGNYPYYGASGIIDYVNSYLFDDELILLGEDGENILSRNLPLAFIAKGKIWVNNHAHVLKPKEDFNIVYLTEYLESLDYSLLNSGTAQPKINQQVCQKIQVLKPPLPEQKAIAQVLSDTDNLIQAIEQKLSKKRAIKQGAIQELLTPKEDWEEKKLGEVSEVFGRIGFRGYTKKDIVPKGKGAIALSPSNINDNELNFIKSTYISWFKYDESPEIKINVGDIVLVKTASIGKTALVKYLPEKATLNPQLVVFKNIKVDNVFLSYIMKDKVFQNQIKTSVVGGVLATLSQEYIKSFLIPLPKTKEEQTQIAIILSDMDAEIEQLEQKLSKYKLVKQGLMQNLLTGKIRLV